jgi:biotin operon repressor
MADEKQSCYPSQQYIAGRLGCSRSSVSRAIKAIEKACLIGVAADARGHRRYQLLSVKSCADESGMPHPRTSDGAPVDINNTKLTSLSNNVVLVAQEHSPNRQSLTREDLLASDIAEALNDGENISRYMYLAKRYTEASLREVLSRVKQTPSEKIRKSRSALFMYLIRTYARRAA